MAALDRAVAFPQVHRVAVHVSQDLDFDVARVLHEFLNVDGRVTECRLRLGTCGVVTVDQAGFVARDAHAASPAAERGFDNHGVADLRGDLHRFRFGVHRSGRAGNDGTVRVTRHLLGVVFLPQARDRLRVGPDEVDLARLAHFGEVSILREESVPRVDRFRRPQLLRQR